MDDEEQKRTLDDWLSSHRGLVFKVLRSFAFNEHDRDDLFQEVAFQLWISIPNFKGASTASTWVYRVALYAAMQWSKKEKRREERRETLDVSTYTRDLIPQHEDPRVAWLYRQVAALPTVDRSLMLLVLEGYSYQEMAKTLGLSESNVGVKINRIKKAMARQSDKEESHGIQ
ncbi:MAG: RNA polymerase sigma factor [Planctomycetota bacterium]|jgi:RNA polymerase sigma-70 factor (ECF subfamily)